MDPGLLPAALGTQVDSLLIAFYRIQLAFSAGGSLLPSAQDGLTAQSSRSRSPSRRSARS